MIWNYQYHGDCRIWICSFGGDLGDFWGEFLVIWGDFSKEGIVAAKPKVFVCECCRHLAIPAGSGENLKPVGAL